MFVLDLPNGISSLFTYNPDFALQKYRLSSLINQSLAVGMANCDCGGGVANATML